MGVVIKQSIKGTIVNYVGIAIGFLTTFFIVTKYLTQEEIGLNRVLIDAGILFASFTQLGTTPPSSVSSPISKTRTRNTTGFSSGH